MRFTLALPLVVLFTAPAAAHPLTDIRFDRTVAIRLADNGVEVTYTLEVGLLTMYADGKRLTAEDIAALDRTPRGFAAAYARRVAPELVERLRMTADGARLALEVKAIDVTFTDHATCRFTLSAPWPAGGPRRELSVHDETFADRPGIINLTLDRKADARLTTLDLEDPPLRVRTQPLSNLTPEEADLARRASAVLMLPAPIAVPDAATQVPAQSIPEPVVNAGVPPAPNLFADLSRRGLPALFDSPLGVGVLLLAAFLFGAAHAFTPGHGKTLVAAYLVGERGTVKHAVILALATTIAHTGSVIAVAAILWGVYGNNVPGATQGTLQFIAGLLVIGVGLWLLLRRVTGQADHFHLFAGHHHHHDHDGGHSHDHGHEYHHHHGPPPESEKTTGGWLRIVLMGLGGGLVPCWDAVLLLVAASAMGRLGFAIPLLLAFSLGLGAVLVGLGIGVVYAYRAGSRRFKECRWFRFLPIISAALLVGIGFWLCKQAVGMVAGH